MAIFHTHTKAISRGKGHSATAAAAYIGGKIITDERTGEIFNYSKKQGVTENEIILPENIKIQNLTSEKLWNKAELTDIRMNSRMAREWEISLPHELNKSQQAELARELTLNIANKYQVACEYAIHAPDKNGDLRNHHVHILTTTRKINNEGNLTEKSDIEKDNKSLLQEGKSVTQKQIENTRAMIAATINKRLEKALINERVSHKTLESQGITREPSTHKGKALTEQARRLIKEEMRLIGETKNISMELHLTEKSLKEAGMMELSALDKARTLLENRTIRPVNEISLELKELKTSKIKQAEMKQKQLPGKEQTHEKSLEKTRSFGFER